MKSAIRALLLDFDGTLVDSERLHHDCWNRALDPYGTQIGWEEYERRLVGISDREAGEILLREAGYEVTPERAQAAASAKKRLYQSRFCDELSIPETTLSRVHQLAAIKPVGVVSSSLTVEVEPLLVKYALRERLAVLVCGDHVERRKPHPEPYRLAVHQINQNGFCDSPLAPESFLAIEDSASGVDSATAAGLTVWRVSSPAALPSLLDELL